jgi:ribosomal subunit interface protein
LEIPLQITWRNVEKSEALEAEIRAKANKLDDFCDTIISCRIVVEASHRHHHKGNLYRIRIDVHVPDKEIVVTRDPGDEHAHEDIYVSVRDAFDAVRRQLQDYTRIRRGSIKPHDEPVMARVLRCNLDEGYGFLEAPDGRNIYFHRNAVINADFEHLSEGTEVRYVEELGDKGPQAKQVSVVHRHD